MREHLEQHVPPVYRFALRLTGGDRHAAEDLTQETMLRAWRHRRRLRDDTAARTWLFTIAANLWRDQLRHERVRRRATPHVAPPPPAASTSAHADDRRDDAERVLRALDGLPERQRDVLFLSACEGLTNPQIAEVLGLGPGAVKSSLSVARQRLRERLGERPGDVAPLGADRGGPRP